MADTKLLIKDCTLLPSDGSSLKEQQNITAGLVAVDYFESIENPSIALIITFIDTDQLIGRLGVTGGEYVNLSVLSGEEDDEVEFKITEEDHKLILNSVRNVTTTHNAQVATLEFVSVETYVDQTARVNQKYTGNITETVKKLLKEKTAIGTKKNLDSDEAANSYSFVGNLKHPFDTIQWLCPKTQASKDSFGFLFYENFDGYHFKSIKSLLEQDAFEYKQADKNIGTNAIILHSNLNQTNDIGLNLRMGMYANRTFFIDLEEHTLKEVDYKVENLGLSDPPKIANKLETYPTRLMLKASDVGVSQKGSEKKDKQPKTELDETKNKSYIRNNLLFSQSLNISIPLNSKLRVGFMLDVKFPLKKDDSGDDSVDSYGSDRTNDPSGRYLIAELRHLMGGGKSETQLKLIRDVFTV
tara:strand:- start:1027 stop:2265 length:1239 start_codon:yes stop_codon:yes gene_type:complete